ncbi:MAG: hypothetical protein EB141_00685 [Verrucomicrobia bacterium]|nr:hypothetical protein [Verrucomicrobiota bacterium]
MTSSRVKAVTGDRVERDLAYVAVERTQDDGELIARSVRMETHGHEFGVLEQLEVDREFLDADFTRQLYGENIVPLACLWGRTRVARADRSLALARCRNFKRVVLRPDAQLDQTSV